MKLYKVLFFISLLVHSAYSQQVTYSTLAESIDFSRANRIIDEGINSAVGKSGELGITRPALEYKAILEFYESTFNTLTSVSDQKILNDPDALDYLFRYLLLEVRTKQRVPKEFEVRFPELGIFTDSRIQYLIGMGKYLHRFNYPDEASLMDALLFLNRSIEGAPYENPHAYWIRSQVYADMGELDLSVKDQCRVVEMQSDLDPYLLLYDLEAMNIILEASKVVCSSAN